ncbi:MAG: flavodoxin family protein [Actinomycetota bacterium]|nr:flavodoxin family protein [Actinomycetota bacterium]
MKGTVVYHSRYGNNEKVAKAIAEGLEEAGQDVTLVNAKDTGDLGPGFDFLVMGSPTRTGRASGPVKKFIKNKLGGDWKGKPYAAFGTCLQRTCDLGEKSSGKDIHKILGDKGLKPVAEALDAPVGGMKGPVSEDTLARAREFGKEIGSNLG